MAEQKKPTLIPGNFGIYKNLPVLPSAEMLMIPAKEAVKYLRNAFGPMGFDNDTLETIILRYRDGDNAKMIATDMRITQQSVGLWIQRAAEIHVLQDRNRARTQKPRLEILREESAKKEVEILNEEQKRVKADSELAEKFREKAEEILEKMTPEKIEDAKLKDQMDAASRAITISRLLGGQSTVNTSSRTIVEHITRLNGMTVAEREELIAKKRQMIASSRVETVPDNTPWESPDEPARDS